MGLRLSLNDIVLITFLGRYKQMKAVDCKKIYKSKGYYFKRLKVLEKEILLSNWNKADYMTEDKNYIILMPFINTERVYKLNLFLKNNQKKSRKIDIITLKENKEKLNEILTNKVNIIEIDKWLGGINEQGKEN